MPAQIEDAYGNAVRDALRVLGVDPKCLTDPDLFGVMVDACEAGLSAAGTASEIVTEMYAREMHRTSSGARM